MDMLTAGVLRRFWGCGLQKKVVLPSWSVQPETAVSVNAKALALRRVTDRLVKNSPLTRPCIFPSYCVIHTSRGQAASQLELPSNTIKRVLKG